MTLKQESLWGRAWIFGLVVVVALAGLAMASCGGDDDDDSGNGDNGAPDDGGAGNGDDNGNDDDSDDNGDSNGDDGDGVGGDQARVTIGDETFEFDQSFVCISLGGAVAGAFANSDGTVSADIDIPPEDWETSDDEGWEAPTIRVSDERDPDNEVDWRAGDSIFEFGYEDLEGKSQVDSFSVDGARATGEATFINFSAYGLFQAGAGPEPEPVSGTFEINCGD